MVSKEACCKALYWEFHISRVCLSHHNWRAFAYTPWLPQKNSFQWIYLIYRWILALYFLVHLLVFMIDFFDYFFIYLTDWSYIVLTAYLTWSAVSVTIRYVQQCSPACQKKESREQFKNDNVEVSNCCIVGCCCPQNSLQWYEFIHWLLFVLGIEPAITITMLYWPSYDAATSSSSYYSIIYHLINGLVALMDMWITRIPIRLYHVIYPVIFVSAYSLFTGLYYVGGGLDPLNNTYIYSVLDYENDPGVAAGITVGASLVIVPLFHLFLYCNYILREGLLYIVKKYCCKCLKDNEIHVADISTEDNELA